MTAAKSVPNAQRRSPEARRAILDAAISLISERGYANVTIEAIAASAGVGKTTIYRWWPSKGELSLEAINDRVGEAIDFPDTGDIEADLRHQLLEVARVLDGEIGVVFRGVVAEAQSTPSVGAALLDSIIEPRTRACEARLAKAVGDGQLRPDVATRMMVELIYAPLYYRVLFRYRPCSAPGTSSSCSTTPCRAFAPSRQASDGPSYALGLRRSGVTGAADRPRAQAGSRPGHVDRSLEVDVAGTREGLCHRGVAQVRGRPDPRDVLVGEDPRAFAQQVVDVAVAPMRGQDADVGDDRVVGVPGGDDETDRFAVLELAHLPPVPRAGEPGELVVEVLGGNVRRRHRLEVSLAVSVERPLQDRLHQRHQLVTIAHRPESQAPARDRNRGAGPPLEAKTLDERRRPESLQDGHARLDDASRGWVVPPVGRDVAPVLRGRRSGRHDGGQRGSQEPGADLDGRVRVQGVVEVEEVQDVRRRCSRSAPP